MPRYATTSTALLYLSVASAGHLLWEAAQLPLYTIWWIETKRAILFAVIHCTAGDALITAAALIVAILAARLLRWPIFGGRMALAAVLLGLGYTVFSEWLNTRIRHSWSYITPRRCPFYRHSAPASPPFCNG